MEDKSDVHLTPVTPGRSFFRNPFESPNDYHRLHESLVPSPSVFEKVGSSSATPAKFKWSIDEMANLLPVEIDPEDIHRQAMFLSQARADATIETKRQHAIEQFFTKGAIVPSPWGPTEAGEMAKPLLAYPYLTNSSPHVKEECHSPKKMTAICQTDLSLPTNFNLEKILGDYYKTEELTEQVQENLSNSSLRRKLFLDGFDSGSESSTPASPDRSQDITSAAIASPIQSEKSTRTLSGQFSSSPIQGPSKTYSLEHVKTPIPSERVSPTFKTPTFSPISLFATPVSGEEETSKILNMSSSNMNISGMCVQSPYVEGCSPIRIFGSRNKACLWASPKISPILCSKFQDPEKELANDSIRFQMSECDTDSVFEKNNQANVQKIETSRKKSEVYDGNKDVNRRKHESSSWIPEDVPASSVGLSSSETTSAPDAESTHMFTSMFAEGSVTPYDVSMQVDSGYNTNSVCATSLMDTQNKDILDTLN